MNEKLISWIKDLFSKQKLDNMGENKLINKRTANKEAAKRYNSATVYLNEMTWNEALLNSSQSKIDADTRKGVYGNVIVTYNKNKEEYINSEKFIKGIETPSLLEQFVKATLCSYVRSFSGLLSIERDMKYPSDLLQYSDITSKDMKSIQVVSELDFLVNERSIATLPVQKLNSIDPDPLEYAGKILTELYTKAINSNLINCIKNNYNGDTCIIDDIYKLNKLSDSSSLLAKSQLELNKVDKKLAERSSIKDIKATAYIVGNNINNWFRKLTSSNNFLKNKDSSYINNLAGWYRGIPVLWHRDIEDNEGYAVYKSIDGKFAPLMRGIFLPLTNKPIIGDLDNSTQFDNGIYYREAVVLIAPELVQKFAIE